MSLLRKGILATFGSIIGIIISIITQMILSRKLMPDGMGQYQLFLNLSTMATAIATLGIGQAAIYFINRIKSDIDKVVSNAIFFGLIIGLLLSGVLLVLVRTYSDYFGAISIIGILGFLLSCQGIIFVNLLRPVLIAQLRMKEAVLVSLILPLVYLIIVVSMAVSNNLTVNTAISSMALGHTSSVILLGWFLRKHIRLLSLICFDLFKQMFSLGLKLATANIMQIASTSIGLFLLRYLIKDDFTAIGYYGRAIAVAGLLRIIPASVMPALYSKWSQIESKDTAQQVERAMRMQVALGLATIIGLLLLGKYIIIILYGRAFLPALSAMNILVFSQVLRAMTDIYVNLFASDGKPMLNTFVLAISIPIVIVLSIIFVPSYGINGAALAETISAIVSLTVAIIIAKKINSVEFSKSLVLNLTDIRYINNALIKKHQI